jgi:hypothetical protein
MLDDLLSASTLKRRGLVDPNVVQQLRTDNDRGLADNSLQIYALLSLELWLQTFIDRTWRFDDLSSLGALQPTSKALVNTARPV